MINFKKPFAKFGTLSVKDLSKITAQPQALRDNLVRSGYINEEGVLLVRFTELQHTQRLWNALLDGKYVNSQGMIPSKWNELRQTSLGRDLIKDAYIDENGTALEDFKYVRQSSDLGLDKNFKDKKEAVLKVLRKTHAKAVTHEWVESIMVALILAMCIRTFALQAFKIPSGSMRMTLLEGDRIIVDKLTYGPLIPYTKYRLPGFSHPQRGDVVVFVFPDDHKKDFIKRLIAVGGETVEIRDQRIYVNGKKVSLKKSSGEEIDYYNRGEYGEPNQVIKVPEDAYFVLGDNSASSMDSRYWGFVPKELMIGRADLIYWPPQRIRLIK